MQLFYVVPGAINGDVGMFSEQESHHILHVLRLKDGETIVCVDGIGNRFTGTLFSSGKKKAGIQIQQKESITPPEPQITMYIGILKNRTRMEWMVEKLTETGVHKIVFLTTERTEKSNIRLDRMGMVAISAMKQCLRADLPEIEKADFDELSKYINSIDDLFIAHEKKETAANKARNNLSQNSRLGMLIGPEGGFTNAEVQQAIEQFKAIPLWLGGIRLRTETAAIHAAGLIRFNSALLA